MLLLLAVRAVRGAEVHARVCAHAEVAKQIERVAPCLGRRLERRARLQQLEQRARQQRVTAADEVVAAVTTAAADGTAGAAVGAAAGAARATGASAGTRASGRRSTAGQKAPAAAAAAALVAGSRGQVKQQGTRRRAELQQTDRRRADLNVDANHQRAERGVR